ncbi:cyclin-dependent kinase inhibitor 1 [Nematolebias whitei]|uniref:cyclin-dependent kinase inhibitor 1 n=1 Tax=Nematolebias whitei TaxID=451745 RepID=UPI0018978618|nr:cyclin-dependent kinase inhibitor 1 [Nematolebias whitei]
MCRVMATTQKRVPSALGRSGPTRRNLFGPVDREQLQVEYRAALSQDLEEATKRWGFDFVSGKPLESGDFQWEGVTDTRVPLLYRSCRLSVGQARGQRATRSVGSTKRGRVGLPPESEKENIPHMPEKRTLDLEDMEKTQRKEEDRTGLKRKQTNITDFYQTKRRVVWLPQKSGE